MSIERVLDRAASDPAFMKRFMADPIAAARSAGIPLSAEEAERAKATLARAPARSRVETLQPRVSRMAVPLGVFLGHAPAHAPGAPDAAPADADGAPPRTDASVDAPDPDAADAPAADLELSPTGVAYRPEELQAALDARDVEWLDAHGFPLDPMAVSEAPAADEPVIVPWGDDGGAAGTEAGAEETPADRDRST